MSTDNNFKPLLFPLTFDGLSYYDHVITSPPEEFLADLHGEFVEHGSGLGCSNCERGWVHACCDDLCRNSNDASDCSGAIACRACNPEGDFS